MECMTLDPAVVDAVRRNSVAVSSRISALAIYGYLGIVVGIFIALGGAPSLLEQVYGPIIRYEFGMSAFLGGLLLMFGAVKTAFNPHSRAGWWASAVGVAIFAAWTAVFATTYGIHGIRQGFVVAHWMEPISPDAPRPYVPFLYQSISFLAILHLVTLLRLGIPRR